MCTVLNYAKHFLVLVSDVSSCISIFVLASLVVAPLGIATSAIGLKMNALTAGIKSYQSIIKKKEKVRQYVVSKN